MQQSVVIADHRTTVVFHALAPYRKHLGLADSVVYANAWQYQTVDKFYDAIQTEWSCITALEHH